MVSMAAKGMVYAVVVIGGVLNEIGPSAIHGLRDVLRHPRIRDAGPISVKPTLHLIKGGRS